jgi:hypothetical protein
MKKVSFIRIESCFICLLNTKNDIPCCQGSEELTHLKKCFLARPVDQFESIFHNNKGNPCLGCFLVLFVTSTCTFCIMFKIKLVHTYNSHTKVL